MRIAIASDHGGFEQKGPLAEHIESLGHEVMDMGPTTADRGVLICGTGIGMALAADKVPGIRAANIQTPQFAELFREHNDGNVLCLSGRFTSLATNEEIVDVFLTQEWAGGRHAQRVEKIAREDDPGFTGVGEDFGLS